MGQRNNNLEFGVYYLSIVVAFITIISLMIIFNETYPKNPVQTAILWISIFLMWIAISMRAFIIFIPKKPKVVKYLIEIERWFFLIAVSLNLVLIAFVVCGGILETVTDEANMSVLVIVMLFAAVAFAVVKSFDEK